MMQGMKHNLTDLLKENHVIFMQDIHACLDFTLQAITVAKQSYQNVLLGDFDRNTQERSLFLLMTEQNNLVFLKNFLSRNGIQLYSHGSRVPQNEFCVLAISSDQWQDIPGYALDNVSVLFLFQDISSDHCHMLMQRFYWPRPQSQRPRIVAVSSNLCLSLPASKNDALTAMAEVW